MLQRSYLKFIAACVVYESALSKYAKIQTLRFIENEASEDQMRVFLLEGKIRKVGADEVVDEAVLKYLPPVMVVRAAITAGKLAYNKFFGPAVKACAGRKGDDKKMCIKNYKLKANYAKLAALRKEATKCNQTNDANKCRKMFADHMRKIEKQIQRDRSY